MKLDDHGRCPNCLIKPVTYRRERKFWCHRCCRSFDMETGKQKACGLWKAGPDDTFVPVYPDSDYVNVKPTAVALKRANVQSIQ